MAGLHCGAGAGTVRRMELPQVPPDASLPFACELFTRWSDEDNQGVLNNAIYLTLFEEGRHRYFLGLGLLDSAQFPFLLAQTHLKFLAPGRGVRGAADHGHHPHRDEFVRAGLSHPWARRHGLVRGRGFARLLRSENGQESRHGSRFSGLLGTRLNPVES